MPNINLLVISKTTQSFVIEGIDEYSKRLKHFCNFKVVVIPEGKNYKSLSKQQIKIYEANEIRKHLDNKQLVVLLDEKGKEYSSSEFANFIEKNIVNSLGNITFVVGGAYGIDDKLKQEYPLHMSLSKMTFTHQMIRLFFVEQIYRAFSIINHLPYHNE